MQTYQTGDSLIFKVPEREISLLPAALYPEAFPVAEAEAVIQPIALSIHSWVVQTPYDLIVIDTATGNGRERGGNPLYHQLSTPYLENLRAAGVNPEDVTLVLLTHLHTDHVGWNTVWQDDRWVPLFPNARYLCSAKELSRVKNSERYRALWLDSLLPVIEAGQLETVDVATRRGSADGSTLFPPPATVRTMPRWSSPPEMTTPVSPAIFCIPRSSLPIRSGIQRSAAIPGRRKSRDGR